MFAPAESLPSPATLFPNSEATMLSMNYCRSLERKYLDERLGIPGIFQEVEGVRPQVGWPAPIRTWESH